MRTQTNSLMTDLLNGYSHGADKGKVGPVIYLTEHHAMKAYCGMEV